MTIRPPDPPFGDTRTELSRLLAEAEAQKPDALPGISKTQPRDAMEGARPATGTTAPRSAGNAGAMTRPGESAILAGAARVQLDAFKNLWSSEVKRVMREPASAPVVSMAGHAMRLVPNLAMQQVATASRSERQAAYEARMAQEGKRVLWVQITGTLNRDPAEGVPGTKRDGKYVGWDPQDNTQFSYIYPVAYDPTQPPDPATLRRAVAGLMRPGVVLDADPQRPEVPEGSLLTVTGRGFVGTKGRLPWLDDADDSAEHDVTLISEQLQDGDVYAALRWQRREWEFRDDIKKLPAHTKLATAKLELDVQFGPTFGFAGTFPGAQPDRMGELLALDVDALESANRASGFVRDKTLARTDFGYDLGVSTPWNLLGYQNVPWGLGVGIGLSFWNNRLSDERINEHPIRAQVTRDHAKRGKRINWFETGGVVQPQFSLLPSVGGWSAADIRPGVQGGTTLRWNFISGQRDNDLGWGKSARDAIARTWRAVVDDGNELFRDDLPAGSTLGLQAIVTARGLVQSGSGPVAELPLGMSLGARIDAESSKERLWDTSVTMTKLNHHQAWISRRTAVQTTNTPIRVHGDAGIDLDTVELLRNYDDTDGASSGDIESALGGKLNDLVVDTMEHFLEAEVTYRNYGTVADAQVEFALLDRNDPDHRWLLKHLMKPHLTRSREDRERAEEIWQSAIHATQEVTSAIDGNEASVEAFTITWGEHGKESNAQSGRVTTPEGMLDYEVRKDTRTHDVIQEVTATWNAYYSETDIENGDAPAGIRVHLEKRDPFTSEEEVERFRTALGLLGENVPEVEMRRIYPLFSFWKYGRTNLDLDLTVDWEGIEALGRMERSALLNQFARVSAAFDPLTANPPWLAGDPDSSGDGPAWTEQQAQTAREMIERWTELDREVRSQHSNSSSTSPEEREQHRIESRFKKEFGSRISPHAKAYQYASVFAASHDALAKALDSGNEAAALEALSGFGTAVWKGQSSQSDRNDFFWRYLTTVTSIAGPDHVHLRTAQMSGKAFKRKDGDGSVGPRRAIFLNPEPQPISLEEAINNLLRPPASD